MPNHLSVNWAAFQPKQYLKEYYDHIGAENDALLRFLVDSFRSVPKNSEVLDFGTGPTAYQLIAAANTAKTIDCAEFLEVNRRELGKWVNNQTGKFSWKAYTSRIMELENGAVPSGREIAQREKKARLITRIIKGDATKSNPLNAFRQYDVLSFHFLPESITDSRKKYIRYLSNIMSTLKPSGTLIMSAIVGADHYKAGDATFPAVPISEHELIEEVVKNGIVSSTIRTQFVPAEKKQGYDGLLFLSGKRG